MTPDLDRIRTAHAAAIANRQRGSFDSRDDDIGALLGEIDRLNGISREAHEDQFTGTPIDGDPIFNEAIVTVYREREMK